MQMYAETQASFPCVPNTDTQIQVANANGREKSPLQKYTNTKPKSLIAEISHRFRHIRYTFVYIDTHVAFPGSSKGSA